MDPSTHWQPRLVALLCVLALGACGGGRATGDEQVDGSFATDAWLPLEDAGKRNDPGATETDAGTAPDAGDDPLDAGPDGGSVDGPDAGVDAGEASDGGADAGDDWDSGVDAGDAVDGGFDAGEDAGAELDAGVDAGIPHAEVIVDLRVDTNRDGIVSVTDDSDEAGEDDWTATRGAIFLANIDDDLEACSLSYANGSPMTDADLPKCNDAADLVINGPDDLEDLARIKTVPWPGAPPDAVGRISVSPSNRVRLFKGSGTSFAHFAPATSTLSTTELRNGIELAIEGLDIVRDLTVWDGTVSITLQVTTGGVNHFDTVRMRVAPVILFHHVSDVDRLFATNISGNSDSAAFQSALSSALSTAGVARPLTTVMTQDQWTQDFFETGYMSMPAPGGGQKVIRVAFRSANVYGSGNFPLRSAGRVAFALRGKDYAGIQQYDPNYDRSGVMDTLDSFGNTETIPPFTHAGVSYPLGRILRGSVPSYAPDPSFTRMLAAQRMQPIVNIDTSWLLVAHVDETISFIRADTPRGWLMLVNDPLLARNMLQYAVNQGHGAAKMFVGKQWLSDFGLPYSAEVTVQQVLQDPDVMAESARSAAEIDAQVAIIKAATGITDAEIVRIPFLHYPVDGYSLAYQPGTVNGIVINRDHYFAPDPHGPMIDGQDMFKVQLQAALQPYGVTVQFIEDWNLYHRLAGEIHCGTNAERVIPSTKWWESGR